MPNDILACLRLDSGRRTLGQLLQDREAAIHEIARLRSELEHQSRRYIDRDSHARLERPTADTKKPPFGPGSLVQLSDVCNQIGLSRSSLYKRLSDGDFPRPVRLGQKMVRWRLEDVEAWREGLRK
jgi:prophage regulatory protein